MRIRAGSTLFLLAASPAAVRARSRNSSLVRWRGFGAPSGSLSAASSLGVSSRMLRTADIAARSAARCTRPLPVAAPPIAASARAARIRMSPAPRRAGSACPRLPPAGRVNPPSPRSRRAIPDASSETQPPGRAPASARLAASCPGARVATRQRSRRRASSSTASAASDRSAGSETSRQPPAAESPSASSAGTQSRPGRLTTASSASESATAVASAPIASPSSSARWQTCPRADARRPDDRSAASSSRAPEEASRVGPRRRPPTSTSSVPAPVSAAASTATAAASAWPAPRSAPVARIDGVIRHPGGTATMPPISPRARPPRRRAVRGAAARP